MKYFNGSEVKLGNIVQVPIPQGNAKARIVMLGETYAHIDIEAGFLEWVLRDKVLRQDSVIIEWIEENPFDHNDPKYAPVGNYMFCPLDEFVKPMTDQTNDII